MSTILRHSAITTQDLHRYSEHIIATELLLPAGDYGTPGLTKSGGSTNYENVDEPGTGSDDDATYVYGDTNSDEYTVTMPTSGTWEDIHAFLPIDFIRVWFRAKKTSGSYWGRVTPTINNGTGEVSGELREQTTDYTWFYSDFPLDGGGDAFTWAGITSSFRIGISVASETGGTVRVTAVQCEIFYLITPGEILRPESDDTTALSTSSGTQHFALIDDAAINYDDFIYTFGDSSWKQDSLAISDTTGTADTITGVTVVWYNLSVTTAPVYGLGVQKGFLSLSSTEYAQAHEHRVRTAHYCSATWILNPATAAPWTYGEIDDVNTLMVLAVKGAALQTEAIYQAFVIVHTSTENYVDFDSLLQGTATEAIDFDAELESGTATFTETVDLDGVLQKALTTTVNLDTYLNAIGLSSTVDLDGLLTKVLTIISDFDAQLSKTASHTVDLEALLTATGQFSRADIDALLQQAGTKTVSLDSFLYSVGLESADLDALLGFIPWTKPTSHAIDAGRGTIESGDVWSLQEEDGSLVTIAELTGPNGFLYVLTFGENGAVPTTKLDADFYCYYVGNAGHTVSLQQWNYTLSQWDDVVAGGQDFPDAASLTRYDFPLIDSGDYISGGQIMLRIEHSTPGVASHRMYFDTVAIHILGEYTVNLDALLNGSGLTATISADALLTLINQSVTTSLDAYTQKAFSQTVSLDSLLNKLGITLTTDIDAILESAGMETVELTALLNALGLTDQTDLDAVLQQAKTTTLSLDSLLNALNSTQTLDLDSLLTLAGVTETADLDAVLAKTTTGTINLDTLLNLAGIPIITSLDAILGSGSEEIISLDALLNGLQSGTIDIDALLQENNVQISVNLDSLLNQIKATSLNLEALLNRVGSIQTNLDVQLFQAQLETVSLDAVIGSLASKILNLDAYLTQTRLIQASLDGLLNETDRAIVSDLDGILVNVGSVTTQADALLTKTQTSLVDLDSLLNKVGQTISVNLDAVIGVLVGVQTTIDALLTGTGLITIDLDKLLIGGRASGLSFDSVLVLALDNANSHYIFKTRLF